MKEKEEILHLERERDGEIGTAQIWRESNINSYRQMGRQRYKSIEKNCKKKKR